MISHACKSILKSVYLRQTHGQHRPDTRAAQGQTHGQHKASTGPRHGQRNARRTANTMPAQARHTTSTGQAHDPHKASTDQMHGPSHLILPRPPFLFSSPSSLPRPAPGPWGLLEAVHRAQASAPTPQGKYNVWNVGGFLPRRLAARKAISKNYIPCSVSST